MHELSLAENIVAIAENYADKHEISFISEVEIEVGMLAGVEIEALEFALNSAVVNTNLESANLKIIYISGLGKCLSCGLTFNMDTLQSRCPDCNDFNPKVLQGKELRVKSISGE
ncbi:hydrogenase maturation nickel metallochaperone HypA [Candidatus Dojkabacteria bacterium]|nr:hydrogenase maturation nickel metallochaperone HypA [Candidatus Dojkabacteria bacterium]